MARSKVRYSAILVITLLFVVSCAAASTAAEKSKDFIYVSPIEATTLDPHKHSNVNTARVLRQIFETMYRGEENGVVPVLATEAVEVDPLTWKITIREGVYFHCGEPLTSAAVKYSWDRLLDPATAAPRRSAFTNIKSVECPSDHEVLVHLHERSLAFVNVVLAADTTSVICPVCAEKYGLQGFTMHPCGTGALKFDHWDPGIEIVLVRNENYWGRGVKVDKITYRALGEDASRVMMLMTGDADVIASVPPALVPNLQNNPDVKLVSMPSNRTMHLGYNHNKAPFNDVRVRQALTYAIDRRSIIDNVFNGMASYPANGYVTPAINDFHPSLDLYPYNPEKAKELLAEAGYPDGFSCELLTSEGVYLMDRQVAEIIQAMLAEVGVKLNIQVRDWGAYQEQLISGNLDMYLTGLGNATNDASYAFAQFFAPGATQNFSRVDNVEINTIMANLPNSKNLEERRQALYRAQEILMENAHTLPLYYETLIQATRADIEGFRLFPIADETWGMERVDK